MIFVVNSFFIGKERQRSETLSRMIFISNGEAFVAHIHRFIYLLFMYSYHTRPIANIKTLFVNENSIIHFQCQRAGDGGQGAGRIGTVPESNLITTLISRGKLHVY